MQKLRSVFISDVHLGAPHAHAEELASFLSNLDCERLYLVGDIVDLWWVSRRRATWNKAETRVLDLLRRMPKRGIEVIYIPGNHDAALRAIGGQLLAGVQVRAKAEHFCSNGQRLLITHGDQFDRHVRFCKVQKAVGGYLYDGLLDFDAYANALRKRFGMRRFSLANWIKARNGQAKDYLQRFESAVADSALQKGFDGAVCGHIHHAKLSRTENFTYANCGDWVENLTAIAEDHSGALIQLQWNPQAIVSMEVSQAIPKPLQLSA
jgi:UDP-2,3-diacylglucosamine pyrophosphatase LpxH